MENAMQLATSFPMWIIALIIIGIVIFQAIVFMRLATKTSQSVGLTNNEVKSAIKVGGIFAIGPVMGSMIIAVSLITFLTAQAYGAELGSGGFNEQAFTTFVWTLCLGRLGWLFFSSINPAIAKNNREDILPTNIQFHRHLKGTTMGGSSDVGDVSWITPVSQVMTTCAPIGVQLYSWQATASFGSTIGFKGMHLAAKTMALSVYDLLTNPTLIEKAQAEFKQSTQTKQYKPGIP